MFFKMWREEFQKDNFKMEYSKPEDFSRCCWQRAKKVTPTWLLFRSIVFLYFALSFMYVIVDMLIDSTLPNHDKPKLFIFLTNWTYILQINVFFYSLFITLLEHVKQQYGVEPPSKMTCLYKTYWIGFTIALPASVVVTIMFWVKVYDPVLFPANGRNVVLHAFNSIFMILDFILVGHPIRFLHFYWPILYAVAYLIFSVIYQLSGGTGQKGQPSIYKVLDWVNEPQKAGMTCLMTLLLLVLSYLVFCSFSMLKFWLRKKFTNANK